MKKVISILIVLSMLASFAACAGSGSGSAKDTKPSTTTSPTVTTPAIEYEQDDLPEELDFGGATVNILSMDNALWVDEITVEELSSDVINDSIYNREIFVEERLGVEIENTKLSMKDLKTAFTKMMTADEDTYQAIVYTAHISEDISNGYFHDLYEVEYLNLDKPWWSQKFNAEAEMKDKLYLTTGSMLLTLNRFLFATFYNKSLAEDYSESSPELSDLYSIVEDGKWTYDKFYELSSGIYKDLNGNSERDKEDLYGLGFARGISIDTMWSSFDVDILSKNSDGWFELNVNTDKLYKSIENMLQLIYENNGAYVPESTTDEQLDKLATKFTDNSLLFMVNKFYVIEEESLRNMQSDYGILPFPKYDEAQKEYYSYSHDQYSTVCIPATNQNPDVTGAVLEAMASYSYRYTEPAYLDMALKGKYMSDPQSRKMVDIIVDGFKVDAAWIYLFSIGSSFPYDFRFDVIENETSYAANYTARANSMNKNLKLYNKLIK